MRTLWTVLLLAALSSAPCTRANPLQEIPGMGLLRDVSNGMLEMFNDVVDSGVDWARRQAGEFLDECVDCNHDPDAKRNVSEIIRSRQFIAEEYDVVTRDGYILTIQRIVNPLVAPQERAKLKPVLLQHGLMSSSVDWVINSIDIRPKRYPKRESQHDEENTLETGTSSKEGPEPVYDSPDHPNSLGFYLANEGYDVFLGNSRGNIYGQRHVNISSWHLKFWDFTYDEQIKYDLPDTLAFIQKLTNHTKVGYVGHSQGTTMIFGLLSDQPEYADVVEPVVAFAPVAFVSNSISPVKYFAVYTPVFQHVNMWFGSSNTAVKFLAPRVCGPEVIRKGICANIIFLSCGFDESELDESRVSAYLNHMPSGTSVKNIAHWGQQVLNGRFTHFDHGILGNQMEYGFPHAPDYDLSKIRSNSIALFTAENDWLASPKDVAKLKASLKVQPFRVHNITEEMPRWNHIDFVYGKHAGELVNTKVLDIFNHFRASQ